MKNGMSVPSDEDLSAFIDGELGDERRKAVEAALALDADLAAKVAGMRFHDEYLRRSMNPILEEPVPERLTRLVRPAPTESNVVEHPAARRFDFPLVWQAGALAATLVLGIGIGWYGENVFTKRESLLDPFIKQAVLSHELFEANREFEPVEGDSDVISIDAGARPFSLPARTPTLRDSDLVPVMVRTVEGAPGEAIHIAYEDKSGDWTTLYIRKHTNDARLPAKFTEADGYSVLYWLDGPMVYSLVGTGSEDKLRKMAEDIYRSRAMTELRSQEQPQQISPAVAR